MYVCICICFDSALLAVRFLNENLTMPGKIGCLLTVAGSIILVIHAPKDNDVTSLSDFAQRVRSAGNKDHSTRNLEY